MFVKQNKTNRSWGKQIVEVIKKTSLVFFFIGLGSVCFSQDAVALSMQSQSLFLEDLFSDEIVQELRTTGKIQRNFYGEKDVELELWPKTDLGKKTAEYWQRKDDPVFILETVYLVKKNDEISTENDIDRISAILRSHSQMQGTEYYSNSSESTEILYSEVYTVNNMEDKMRINDCVEGNADGLVSYVYQDDRSLGDCIYEFSYFQNENEVSFRAVNVEKLSLVKPENLVITLVATDVGDSIVFYILVQADVPKVSFISERLTRSFSARVDAIYNWCVNMYNGKF